MKKILFLLSLCFVISLPLLANMEKDSIPEPEYINQVYHYDKGNKKLIELEAANAESKMKMKITGGGSQVYTIDGSNSTVRVNGDGNSFMIQIAGGSGMSDPTSTINLYQLESKKGRREAIISGFGGVMNKGQQVSGSTLELRFKKIKDGIYEIVVKGNLEKGEYGFVNQMAMSPGGKVKMYAFGVD